jgi:hypothetical protein
MTRKQYLKRMKQHENTFDMLWVKIVKETNEFIKDNPETTTSSLNQIEKFVDSICLSGAWIQDRINGKSGVTSDPKYRGSLTKGIRKALGYTY